MGYNKYLSYPPIVQREESFSVKAGGAFLLTVCGMHVCKDCSTEYISAKAEEIVL